MPVTLGTRGQPDFTEPLELMMDCHRRIERFIDVLVRVVDDTHGKALPDEHRRALVTALDYFATAAPRHTRDEEDSLFPRLRASGDRAVQEAMERIEKLEADHVVATRAHARIEVLGRQWLLDDFLPGASAREMRATLLELRQAYQRHIRVEDQDIFPLAGRVLDAKQLAEIGQEMKARRA